MEFGLFQPISSYSAAPSSVAIKSMSINIKVTKLQDAILIKTTYAFYIAIGT